MLFSFLSKYLFIKYLSKYLFILEKFYEISLEENYENKIYGHSSLFHLHTLACPFIHTHMHTHILFFLFETATTAASASGALNINQFHSWRQSDLRNKA
jgi:hypothetical protein